MKKYITFAAMIILASGFTSCCVTGYCPPSSSGHQQQLYENEIKEYHTNTK